MRISDWSSDVCSSDLSVLDDLTLVLAAVGKGCLEARWAAAQRAAAEYLDVPETIAVGVDFAVGGRARLVVDGFILDRVCRGIDAGVRRATPHAAARQRIARLLRTKIGRASCRESVCKNG